MVQLWCAWSLCASFSLGLLELSLNGGDMDVGLFLLFEIESHCPQTLGHTPASFFQALGVQHSWRTLFSGCGRIYLDTVWIMWCYLPQGLLWNILITPKGILCPLLLSRYPDFLNSWNEQLAFRLCNSLFWTFLVHRIR